MAEIFSKMIILFNLLFVSVITYQLYCSRKVKAEVLALGCGTKTISSFGCNGYCISTVEPQLWIKGFTETYTYCKPFKGRIKRVVLLNFPSSVQSRQRSHWRKPRRRRQRRVTKVTETTKTTKIGKNT